VPKYKIKNKSAAKGKKQEYLSEHRTRQPLASRQAPGKLLPPMAAIQENIRLTPAALSYMECHTPTPVQSTEQNLTPETHSRNTATAPQKQQGHLLTAADVGHQPAELSSSGQLFL
jgi:hypothetical protein